MPCSSTFPDGHEALEERDGCPVVGGAKPEVNSDVLGRSWGDMKRQCRRGQVARLSRCCVLAPDEGIAVWVQTVEDVSHPVVSVEDPSTRLQRRAQLLEVAELPSGVKLHRLHGIQGPTRASVQVASIF